MTIAKNIDFEKNVIENIFTSFNNILQREDKIIDNLPNSSSAILGRIKWKVTGYEKILYHDFSALINEYEGR